MQNHNDRVRLILVSLLLTIGVFLSFPTALADKLTNRSITVPTALANSVTSHQFRFDFASANNVGSLAFEYCDNSPLPQEPCSLPAGLDVSNVTLGSQFGQTGFSMNSNTTSNRIVISRPSLSVVPGAAGYTFNNAVNPSTPNKTVFVRISTYASSDATGSSIDEGSVAFTLAPSLAVNAFVPPFLALCTGVTVAVDCSTTNGTGVNMGTLSATQASSGSTQMAAATNDNGGYTLFVNGTTMTSGNNVINPLSAPTVSSPATSQFGVNLRSNTVPNVGHEPEGSGIASPSADYNQSNLYKFNNGDALAASRNSTDYNRFTVSYMVNIPFGQAPGVYSTTLTYTAVTSF